LADKLIVAPSTQLRTSLAPEEAEKAKLALASDLKWLIDGGHLIEFNDGSLDLPRVRTKPNKEQAADGAEQKETDEANASPARTVAPKMSGAEKEARVEAGAPAAPEPAEDGPPAHESSKAPKESGDVVAAV